MNKLRKCPLIQNYTQITQYLNDYFLYRRSLDKMFSFDIWAAELGFKSRSFMRMLTSGERHITSKVEKILSLKMGFSTEQEEYFKLLILHSRAKSFSQKKIYLEKMSEFTSAEPQRYDIKDYAQFVSSPNLSVILLLISFEDVIASEAVLKKLTGLTASELRQNLKLLKELGLIEQDRNKIWMARGRSFKIPAKPKDSALLAFHKKSLQEAEKILDTQPVFRKFRSIYFGVADNHWEDLNHEVEVFLNKMKNKFSGSQMEQKRLFKLNLQAYPVSKLYQK